MKKILGVLLLIVSFYVLPACGSKDCSCSTGCKCKDACKCSQC